MKRFKLLVVGQTPPPYGGQSLMIESLVNKRMNDIEIFHVRMSFSSSFRSVGRFEFGKLAHILEIVAKVLYLKFRHQIPNLYYPVAGPNLNPVLRDLAILTIIRPFFAKTIFHFHAAGVSELLKSRSKAFQLVARCAYDQPDGSIQLSPLNPPDGEYFRSRKSTIVPYGIQDCGSNFIPIHRPDNRQPRILYVGVLTENKGIMELLGAARLVAQQNIDFQVVLVGEPSSEAFQNRIRTFCQANHLTESVTMVGEKLGDEKWAQFVDADIFCFPTFFEAESFGIVLLEAMMFGLPTVATFWRGIPDVVENRKTGFLVPIKDEKALADKLLVLIRDKALRDRMGMAGRERYERHFQLRDHLRAMEQFLSEVAVPST